MSRPVGRPREYANRAQKQQAYRDRKAEKDIKARHALERMERLEGAVTVAACNGTLPYSIIDNSMFGDWFDNLIDYLLQQQSLGEGSDK